MRLAAGWLAAVALMGGLVAGSQAPLPPLSVFQVAEAGAHNTGYCGHGSVYWSKWSYGQKIYYREAYRNDYVSAGVHFHQVRTFYRAGVQEWYPWILIHGHDRACGGLHA